jgi:plasmid stabilization system protein ParE
MAAEIGQRRESSAARSLIRACDLIAVGAARSRAREDYLMDFNPKAAAELAEGLVLAGDGLAHFPHRGRRVPKTDMRERVTAHPYIIRYRIVRDDVVRILRVRHTSRRPTIP